MQEELVKVLQQSIRDAEQQNLLVSVIKVTVTIDLSVVKVCLSIFPEAKTAEVLKGVTSNSPPIKHEPSQITKHRFRRIPELLLYIDGSLQYIEGIEQSLKEEKNLIENRELLHEREMI